MIYIKINETLYAASISGKLKDAEWNERATKTIKLSMDYDVAKKVWTNGVSWSIIKSEPAYELQLDEKGNPAIDEQGQFITYPTMQTEEFDNSDYSILCSITNYFDGTIAVTMGKLTPLEEAYEMLLGGI